MNKMYFECTAHEQKKKCFCDVSYLGVSLSLSLLRFYYFTITNKETRLHTLSPCYSKFFHSFPCNWLTTGSHKPQSNLHRLTVFSRAGLRASMMSNIHNTMRFYLSPNDVNRENNRARDSSWLINFSNVFFFFERKMIVQNWSKSNFHRLCDFGYTFLSCWIANQVNKSITRWTYNNNLYTVLL